jgi:hypothetical protein
LERSNRNREVDEVIDADSFGLMKVDAPATSLVNEEGIQAMKLPLGWLNQPYLIIIVALAALAFAIAGTKSDDTGSPNPTDPLVIYADRPSTLDTFLIGRGWEDPPAPGDLSPIRGQEGQDVLVSPAPSR